MIVAIVSDLIFQSRIEAVARQSGAEIAIYRHVDRVLEALPGAGLLMVDMNIESADPLALVETARTQHPELRIIAFLAHVQKELAERAALAGADEVLARSTFVERLPEIVSVTR